MTKRDHQNCYINRLKHAHSLTLLFLSYTVLPDLRICCKRECAVLSRRRRHLRTRIQSTISPLSIKVNLENVLGHV